VRVIDTERLLGSGESWWTLVERAAQRDNLRQCITQMKDNKVL
jgi:hypothetical protein